MSLHETDPRSRRPTLPPSAICVLLGGPSAEHDVSLVSGRSIAAALLERGHGVSGWLIDLESRWWQLPQAALDPGLPARALRDPLALGGRGPLSAAAALEALASSGPRPVIFPAVHGTFGEDGQLQSLLESAGLTYCGAGPAASAVGMDKTLFKRVCGSLELPVLPWLEVRAPEYAVDAAGIEAALLEFSAGLPDGRLICKPARQGSSIGITIVRRPDDLAELRAALQEALRYDDLVLLEPYLEHPRELETSVLGNSRLDTVAYGPGEVVPGREFYDYVAKYRSDDSRTTPQADLEPALAADIRAAAIEAYLAIGACGFARVDMLLSADGIPFISEINTIPGFTPISLFPRMTAQGGLDFGDTCERIVELALEQAASRPPRHLRVADLP
jgi:D-alanine-D-alanine ligase